MKRERSIGLAVAIVSTALAVFVACTDNTVTAPEPQKPTQTAEQPPALTVGQPVFITPPTGPAWWWEGGFGTYGSYEFKNKSGEALTWTVYSTSFDDQVTVLSAVTTTTQNGDYFRGTLNVKCRQVDAQQGVVRVGEKATAAPFAAAFVNGYGELVSDKHARDGCAPDPKPTPTPQCEESKEPSTKYGDAKWDDEKKQGACEKEVFPLGENAYPGALTVTLCHQTGTQTITTDLLCSADRTDTRNLCRNVACPPPPPGKCYYTISSEPQGADRKALCQQAAGIQYVQWNDAEKHCVIDLPGVYKNVINGIHFNLVPGKSDDACRQGNSS